MHQSSLLFERAKQGDLEAIAALLQTQCQSHNLTVTVALHRSCLQVLLEGETLPSQTIPTLDLVDTLQSLNLPHIHEIKIYGKPQTADQPMWEIDYATTENALIRLTPDQGEAIAYAPEPRDFWQNLRTFNFRSVFPYRDVFRGDLYRSPIIRGLLFFGLFPAALGHLAQGTDFTKIAWLLGIYYASFWGVFLFNLIQPNPFSWRNTFSCVLFTAFVGIPLLLFVQKVPPFSILYAATDWDLIPQLFGFIFGVGVLEETCKALSLYFFLLRPGQLNNPLTAAFYGTMSGLGFAVAEGATYSLGYAVTLVRGEIPLESYVLVNTIRFISLPLFHAVLAGIVGYFLGLASINPSRKGAIMFIGVAIAAVLHGLYDTFAEGILGFGILAFTILLFVVYLRRSQQMVFDMQQAEELYRTNQQ